MANKMYKKHLKLLGMSCTDKITGFTGTLISIDFDLFGCIQGCVSPTVDKDGDLRKAAYFDMNRLVFGDRVSDAPDFDRTSPISAGEHGPAGDRLDKY